MTNYALSLAKAGWYATDCQLRRRVLTATKRASYAWTSFSVLCLLAAVSR